jgi:AAA domain, putative AbiEii toxin, Type IV TA system/AAA ATPase domain
VYIKRFQIGNYKGFLKTAEIDLGPGINVVCGPNNAGKTAVLEALDPNTSANPHRSPKTMPAPRLQPDPVSWANISFVVSGTELAQMMREQAARQYRIPAADPGGPFAAGFGYARNHLPSAQRLVESVLRQNELVFQLHRQFATNTWSSAAFPSFGLYAPDPGINPAGFIVFTMGRDGSPSQFGFSQAGENVDIGVQITPSIINRIYRFSAERMNIGDCPFGDNPNLSPNASDLPRVLSILQANVARFAKFNRLLHEIFPQVKHVSVHPVGNQQVQIRVSAFDPALERDDLALPLRQCGTGIGQVMAILYVVLFASSPQVILIDEPQSFLHPGAVRKLIEVLKSHSEHQFVIATHSPTVISSAEPTTIAEVKMTEGESYIQAIDPTDARSLQLYLADVGARLSDVFGADRILWVEGTTEELCFPLILEKVAGVRMRGTCILSVCSTGDLQTRDANRVFDMYNRLSDRNSLLPPAIGFIFDSDARAEQVKAELVRKSRGLLRFLPRRMYENYLLNPAAIAAVASGIEGFREAPVSSEEVTAIIEEMREDQKYFRPAQVDAARWGSEINAALVLEDVFARLSETRVRFDKILHSVLLTGWLVQNSPEELMPIADVILERLNREYAMPAEARPRP